LRKGGEGGRGGKGASISYQSPRRGKKKVYARGEKRKAHSGTPLLPLFLFPVLLQIEEGGRELRRSALPSPYPGYTSSKEGKRAKRGKACWPQSLLRPSRSGRRKKTRAERKKKAKGGGSTNEYPYLLSPIHYPGKKKGSSILHLYSPPTLREGKILSKKEPGTRQVFSFFLLPSQSRKGKGRRGGGGKEGQGTRNPRGVKLSSRKERFGSTREGKEKKREGRKRGIRGARQPHSGLSPYFLYPPPR